MSSLKPPTVEYLHSASFPEILEKLNISLFISTYQAGKLIVVRSQGGKLNTLLRNFKKIMGLAFAPQGLAIGTQRQIWFLANSPSIAAHIHPPLIYDACFVPRWARITGDIKIHELAWIEDQLWFINTRFSCLCSLSVESSFVPRWQPPFITSLQPEDRCHLNGLALENGQPQYITALGTTNAPEGWRENRVSGGCLMDIPTGEIIIKGLCMPHSPRLYHQHLWLLDSGKGHLCTVDLKTGKTNPVIQLPGFTRGLAFYDRYAFIGLSQIREKRTFGGLPIEDLHSNLECAVWIVDIITGVAVGYLKFVSGCSELFDVQILPDRTNPTVVGIQKSTLNKIYIF